MALTVEQQKGLLASKLLLSPVDMAEAQAVSQSDGGDWGQTGTWAPIIERDPFACFALQKDYAENLNENQMAGRDASVVSYLLYALPTDNGSAPLSTTEHVDITGVGRFNVRAVIDRTIEGLYRMDAERVG